VSIHHHAEGHTWMYPGKFAMVQTVEETIGDAWLQNERDGQMHLLEDIWRKNLHLAGIYR
jgi:hypothetical protein